jgi:hypothetical protein
MILMTENAVVELIFVNPDEDGVGMGELLPLLKMVLHHMAEIELWLK